MTRCVARQVCLALFLFAFSACSSGEALEPVTGKVTYNGQPAAGAIITFHPEGTATVETITSMAVVGDDGTYTLMTGSNPGAKAGKYIVTVIWPDPKKKQTDKQRMAGGSEPEAPDLFGGRYSRRETSKLAAMVKPGANTIETFDLKPNVVVEQFDDM